MLYLVVIVSQCSAQLVIVHVCLVLAEAPQLGHFFRLEELELAIVRCPADEVLMFLVQQQVQKELPQRDCTLHTWGGGEEAGRSERGSAGQGLCRALLYGSVPQSVRGSTLHPIPMDCLVTHRLSGYTVMSSCDPGTQWRCPGGPGIRRELRRIN